MTKTARARYTLDAGAANQHGGIPRALRVQSQRRAAPPSERRCGAFTSAAEMVPSTSSFEVGSDAPVLKIVREVGNPSVARIEQRVDPFSAPMQTDNGYFIIRLQGIEVGTTTLQWTPMFIFERKGPMVRYENGLTGSSQVDVALEDPRQGIR